MLSVALLPHLHILATMFISIMGFAKLGTIQRGWGGCDSYDDIVWLFVAGTQIQLL